MTKRKMESKAKVFCGECKWSVDAGRWIREWLKG